MARDNRRRRMVCWPERSRGAVLFLAVGAVAVLSILALGATSSVMQELRLAKMVSDNKVSFYAARSSIDLVRFLFADDESPGIVTLYDLRSRAVALGGKALALSFVDEESRVNIAAAPEDVVKRLPGLENEDTLAKEIAQANLTVKEELLLIEKMTPEIYNGFKNLVTVRGFGGTNINTAGDQVLAVLGCDQETIGAIKDYRNGPDGIPGTEDDLWFAMKEQIVGQLGENLSQGQRETLNKLVGTGLLSTTSDYIHIYGERGVAGENGVKPSGATSFKAIMNLATGNIVSWGEE
jgi:hypothetical protein